MNTKQARKTLDNFEKMVAVGKHIPRKFNDAIKAMEFKLAEISSNEFDITAVCDNCENEVGISKTPTDKCPVCNKIVVACNACKMEQCYNCRQ